MSRTIEPQGIVETKTARMHPQVQLHELPQGRTRSHRRGAPASAITTTGNWSPGQIFSHSRSSSAARSTASRAAPALVRFFAKPALQEEGLSAQAHALRLPTPAGVVHAPAPDVTFEQGMAELREQTRIDAGEKMTQTSPLLGGSHEQWVPAPRTA